MKRLTIFIIAWVLTLFLGYQSDLLAQKKDDKPKVELTKEEKKELKKKKKEMDPLIFKDFFEERERLKREFGSIQRQITNLGMVVTDRDKEIARLQAQLDSLRNLAANTTANDGGSGNDKDHLYGNSAANNEDYTKGLVFKVQVGDVNQSKLNAEVFQGTDSYTVEKDEDGKLKYTIGYFRDYKESEDFKKYLRKIGISSAWIVAYKDGKKQGMKESLEGK
jgi:vacuolar-type H+-ATPase subunit I/STV1